MEKERISDELDFCAISGWETTAIENHSGIVDNLRNFKSDPGPIAGTLLPVRPVAKQRAMCTALGEAATFDLYLLNDTSVAASGTLSFSVVTPSGRLVKLGEFPAPAHMRDQFSYLVKEGFVTPKLTEEGMYRFKFALSTAPGATQTKEIWVTGVTLEIPCGVPNGPLTPPCHLQPKVATSGITPALHQQLAKLLGAAPQEFVPGQKYDVIVSAGVTPKAQAPVDVGDRTGLEAQPATVVGPVVTTTQLGELADGILDAVRAGTSRLAIPQADALSDGVAKQLAAAGAFSYGGPVGDFRAPWMGNWYFVRKHPVYEGMPVDQPMGIHYQAKGRESNGLLVDGPGVEIIAAYSRDHDRRIKCGDVSRRSLGPGKGAVPSRAGDAAGVAGAVSGECVAVVELARIDGVRHHELWTECHELTIRESLGFALGILSNVMFISGLGLGRGDLVYTNWSISNFDARISVSLRRSVQFSPPSPSGWADVWRTALGAWLRWVAGRFGLRFL